MAGSALIKSRVWRLVELSRAKEAYPLLHEHPLPFCRLAPPSLLGDPYRAAIIHFHEYPRLRIWARGRRIVRSLPGSD